MTQPEDSIDSILRHAFGEGIQGSDSERIALARLNSLIEGIIGEDEANIASHFRRVYEIEDRNNLRAEQRKRLKQLGEK